MRTLIVSTFAEYFCFRIRIELFVADGIFKYSHYNYLKSIFGLARIHIALASNINQTQTEIDIEVKSIRNYIYFKSKFLMLQ